MMESIVENTDNLRIQLDVIKSGTDNFCDDNFLASGGFGKVYKGEIYHSQGHGMVAVKRHDSRFGQGIKEFLKEISILSRYKHENIISLYGFCDDYNEKIIVYEYASNGSFAQHLGNTTLTWKQRIKICLGAARGLRFLHNPMNTQQRILHRDMKSSNILLDENWNAKVSDMGFSTVGPANQHHSFLITNPIGTLGYVDPLCVTTFATKELDIYSLGVVLCEALCGRLCFEKINKKFKSFVPIWKTSYEEKNFNNIIFQDIKEKMDPRSLDIFLGISYRCLQDNNRPTIDELVENLENVLWLQETSELVEQPNYYEEMIKTTIPPLVYRSIDDLKLLLHDGVLVNDGKTWFSLNKKGEHYEMLSAAERLTPILSAPPKYKYDGPLKSRFVGGECTQFFWEFKTRVETQFLSPHVTYRVNLVFHYNNTSTEYLGFSYKLSGETKSWTSYVINKRVDGWLMAELFQFTCEGRHVDLEITFNCQCPLAFEGIEFQPLESVEHEGLEHDEARMQSISHSNTYWEQKMPCNYKEIMKLSTDSQPISAGVDYITLRRGFLINDDKEWFSLAKNGKKCHMISARVVFNNSEWSWESSSESRFKEVAFHPHRSFWIYCRSSMLSPQTTYATYLVYRLKTDQPETPVKISGGFFVGQQYSYEHHHSWFIYLVGPETPIIKGKFYENTHYPCNRAKMKGLPQQRNDGWMEVQLWEFQTGTRDTQLWMNLHLTLYGVRPKGLNVQGILFKPT